MTMQSIGFRVFLIALSWLTLTSCAANKNYTNRKLNIYELPPHNFSINFPSQPDVHKLRPNEKLPIRGGYYFINDHQGYVYIVFYNDYDEWFVRSTSPYDIMSSLLDNSFQVFPSKVVNIKKHRLQSWPALLFDFEDDGNTVGGGLASLYNNRLYMVLCAFKGKEPDLNKVDEFIESFRIKE